MINLKVLAIDQARKGAWSVYDSKTKELLDYGTYDYEYECEQVPKKDGSLKNKRIRKYDYEEAMVLVEKLLMTLIREHNVKMVFLEDVPSIRYSTASRQLLRLQGALIAYLAKRGIPHELVMPRVWQAKYKYKDRDLTKEQRAYKRSIDKINIRQTKKDSLLAVKKIFNMELDNDDLADAILIGHYAVNYRLQK